MEEDKKEVNQAALGRLIAKMKYQIAKNYPFFSPISRQIPIIYRPIILSSMGSPITAGTDGKRIYISDFFLVNSFEDKVTIMMHELLHVLWLHCIRVEMLKDKDYKMLWNLVTDCRINETLYNKGHKPLEDSIVKENIMNEIKRLGFKEVENIPLSKIEETAGNLKLSSEQAYNFIRRWLKKSGKGKDENNGKGGEDEGKMPRPGYGDLLDPQDGKELTEEEVKKITERIHNAIRSGIIEEKMRGEGSENWSNVFDDILVRKEVPWQRIVKNRIEKYLRGRRTWNKFHKKTYIQQAIIPGFKKKRRIKIVIGIDVSGSISDDEFKKFVGEIFNLCKQYKAELIVVMFDYHIKNEYEVKSKKDFDKLKTRRGYGGTSYKDFFEKYGKEKVKVVFTDGYGDQNEIEPYKGTIWITTGTENFNWGKVIKVKNI